MKYFLEMIEHSRVSDIVQITPSNGHTCINKSHFYELVEKCNPLIFKLVNEEPEDIEGDSNIKLDVPFEVFSIEILNGYISIPRDDDPVKVCIKSILAYEAAPKTLYYYVLLYAPQLNKHSLFLYTQEVSGYGNINSIVNAYIDRLNKEKIGVEKVRERIKIGSSKNKKTITIRKIIHVSPLKYTIAKEYTSNRTVNWSQKWIVRGHWRKHDGLGKDRAGEYKVSGFTWITEHTKGPENAPLIKKSRLIE